MLISNSTMRALNDIGARERDVLQAFTSGASPERTDVAQPAGASFTLDPLSVTPPADAYFITSDEKGPLLFTRDGAFALRDGALVDGAGRPVLGYCSAQSTLAPIRANAVDTAMGLTSGARIEADGSVTYERTTIDPRTAEREVQRATMGGIALARFPAGTKLPMSDPQHFTVPAGIAPHIGRAMDGNFGAVTPFARTKSGVDLDLGLQRLQEAYLALEAIRAAGKAQGSVDKTAMDLLK
jgi:flagellar basal body rod protein FlgG